MTFKEKLVKLRKLKGLTQDDFAKAVGVSRQAVYKWESGQSYPEVSKLLEMKVLFGISIDDLLDENYEVIVPEKKKRKRAVKTEKASIPESISSDASEEAAAVEAVVAEEVVIKEDLPASAAAEPVVEATTEEASNNEDDNKKKVGFFGRLFGKK